MISLFIFALKKAENADLNIVVIEPKSGHFTGVLKGLISSENTILVINKSDLAPEAEFENYKNLNPIIISVKEEKNLDQLINLIKEHLKNKFISTGETYITRERHRNNLKKCLDHLNDFEEKKTLEDFDKAAEDLRLATRYLGMLVGKVDVEEVLGSIFNDFCIGK